jgi:hypothetical protein
METLSAGVFGKSIECPKPGDFPVGSPDEISERIQIDQGLRRKSEVF